MLILHVFNDARPGGIEVLAPRILNSLTDHQTGVYVIHGSETTAADVFFDADIAYARGTGKSLANYWRYGKYLRKQNPVAVHIFNCSPLTIFIARLAGIRNIVYSIRGERFGSGWLKQRYAELIWKLALRFKPVLLANSEHTATAFRTRISSKPEIKVIYNPLHINIPEKADTLSQQRFEVIYCGRLSESKNLYLWLDAAKAICAQKPNAVFKLYGEGRIKADLTSYAEKLGIADKTEFMGHVRDIGKAYLSADLLLFLSQYESFGNVVVESIACGVPVLCSDIPSLKEIFADYPEFIVPLNDNLIPEVLTRLEIYPLLKEKALQAREKFIEKFSLEEHVRQLKAVYAALPVYQDKSRDQVS